MLILLLPCMTMLGQDTAQKKKFPVTVSGTMGITYEHYGLSRNPNGWTGYIPRRPWNQVRFLFKPTFRFSKNFSLPVNINFAAFPTNFAGPYAGLKNQSFAQWITNPLNNFGLNPTYKWAELQLGTQYLHYSNLSTGDIGVFGAGVSLRPGTYRFKFFAGTSQQGIDYSPPVPGPFVQGAYKRSNWMAQIGKEKEGKYELALNFVKAKDKINSATPPPPAIAPQEGFTMSVVSKIFLKKGWYINAEGAQSLYTRDLATPLITNFKTFKPLMKAHTSTVKDYAAEAGAGKRSQHFDIGVLVKYIGAGFQTPGYLFLQPDRMDYTVNTRFNAWKDRNGSYRMNIVASAGQRVNNLSNTTTRARQFIGNLNWFTQFNDRFSLNLNYNNFGFQSASTSSPTALRNVSNDIGINPSYTWTTSAMSHLISLNYNYSKYDEKDFTVPPFPLLTSNNTHTVLLNYVPVFFTKEISPDFSVMYFLNQLAGFNVQLVTVSAGLAAPVAQKKVQLRGQLQYTLGKNNGFSANNNIIASCNIDWKVTKKLTWASFVTSNYFKYGNETVPPGARYLESNVRTGLRYRFGK